MEQVLKISIARGGCRFATPLYLGAKYVLTFDGERADEAKSVLFVKPQSDDAHKSDEMSALAQSEYDSTVSGISLNLNKQVLLDWFEDCGACDVDGYVDAHCYVFDADGAILADADVAIEWKPVQFVVDETGFDDWSELEKRLSAVEGQAANHDTNIAAIQDDIVELVAADRDNLETAKADASEKADAALQDAKTYADNIKMQLARMQYVKCDDESTTAQEIYHRVFLTKNSRGEHVIAVDDARASIEGTDPTTAKYVYIDTKQTVTGEKTFQAKVTIDGANGGSLLVPTKASGDSSDAAASTAFVQGVAEAIQTAFTNWWAGVLRGDDDIEWHGKHTFDVQIRANGGILGKVTGDVDATTVEAVTVNATNIDTDSLDVTGAETHAGAETHSGAVTLSNVVSPIPTTDSAGLAEKDGANLEAAWTMFRIMAQFMGGYWRNIMAGGTLGTVGTATWREHDRQNGMVALWATGIAANFMKSAANRDALYYGHFPNVTEVGDSAFESVTNFRVAVHGYQDGESDNYIPGFNSLITAGALAFYDNNYIAEVASHALNAKLFPKLETVGDRCFENCSNVTSVNLPRLKRAGWKSFYALPNSATSFVAGTEVLASELATIDSALTNWFETNWETLKSLDNGGYVNSHVGVFPAIQSLYSSLGGLPYTYFDGTFCNHDSSGFNTVKLPTAQLIGDAAFANAFNLTDIDLSEALVISSGAFYRLGWNRSTSGNLAVLSLPKCRLIGKNGFGADTNDYWDSPCGAVYAPELTHLCQSAFKMCRSITRFYAPNLKRIAAQAFWGCIGLTETTYTQEDGTVLGTPGVVTFDECLEIGTAAFTGRGSRMTFTTASFAKCTKIGKSAFYDCPNLTDLYLTGMTASDIVDNKTKSADEDSGINNWSLSTSTVVHCMGGEQVIWKDNVWQKK